MSSWRNSSPLHQQPNPQQLLQPLSSQPYPSSPSNTTATLENGPRAKCDQVVFEAIAKAAEIVVGSRCWIDHIPPNINSSSSSRRFNLLVPEVQGVRSILQRWKRALHVPLRLDVYYQHADSRRELLERWCLEYAPKTTGFLAQQQQQNSLDPIVQLRQVCKQIVIWLRSLYCWSRMLPAQALRRQNTQNNAIGFSIYVVSEGNDDVSGLISQQGFSSQGQPHSVWTPYGELGWQVFYAPNSVVQRLIPEVSPYAATTAAINRTSSQPIPMRPSTESQQQQEQQQGFQQHQAQAQSFHPSRDLVRRDSTPAAMPTTTATARSAPQHTGRMYQRSKSDVSSNADHHAAMSMAAAGLYSNPHQQQQQQPLSQSPSQYPSKTFSYVSSSNNNNPPTKNLSALSLAMMTLSDETTGSSPTTTVGAAAAVANSEAAEKRRAALHHAPPQLQQLPSPSHHHQHHLSSSPNVFVNPARNNNNNTNKSPLATAGEYGYAYNNHIPTLRPNNTNYHTLNSSNNNHLLPPPSPISSSTTPLGSTPPGYLLGGPTPTPPTNSQWSAALIPPRGAVTPPFTRPMGFVGEPPSQPLPPPATSGATAGAATASHQPQKEQSNSSVAPITSLDLLHSSPFRQPIYGSNNYYGSSMMMMAATDPFGGSMGSAGPGADNMAFSTSPARGSGMMMMGARPRLQSMEEEDPDDMPFAVDTLTNDTGGGGAADSPSSAAAAAAKSLLAASSSQMIMRDMIRPPKRLQLFESIHASQQQQNLTATNINDHDDAGLSALADELAEFKSFGASLMMMAGGVSTTEAATAAVDPASSSTSTPPIPLRT